MPRVVCGMTGDKLACDIIAHAGLTPPSNAGRPIRSTVRLSIEDLVWQSVALEYDFWCHCVVLPGIASHV